MSQNIIFRWPLQTNKCQHLIIRNFWIWKIYRRDVSESSYKNRYFINLSIGSYYPVIIWAKIFRIEETGTVLYWYSINQPISFMNKELSIFQKPHVQCEALFYFLLFISSKNALFQQPLRPCGSVVIMWGIFLSNKAVGIRHNGFYSINWGDGQTKKWRAHWHI